LAVLAFPVPALVHAFAGLGVGHWFELARIAS